MLTVSYIDKGLPPSKFQFSSDIDEGFTIIEVPPQKTGEFS